MYLLGTVCNFLAFARGHASLAGGIHRAMQASFAFVTRECIYTVSNSAKTWRLPRHCQYLIFRDPTSFRRYTKCSQLFQTMSMFVVYPQAKSIIIQGYDLMLRPGNCQGKSILVALWKSAQLIGFSRARMLVKLVTLLDVATIDKIPTAHNPFILRLNLCNQQISVSGAHSKASVFKQQSDLAGLCVRP